MINVDYDHVNEPLIAYMQLRFPQISPYSKARIEGPTITK